MTQAGAKHPDELLGLAEELVEHASERGVTLRILGSLGIRKHLQDPAVHALLAPTADLDFAGYSEHHAETDRFFLERGYEPDHAVAHSHEYGIQRLIYHRRGDLLKAEVFLDELRMAHTLTFRGRLELDYPTVSLADLLLTKLQIRQLTTKDVNHMIALLAEHDLGGGGPETIDTDYLVALTSADWGLHQSATTNLRIVEQALGGADPLAEPARRAVAEKVQALVAALDESPKTTRWKLRAKMGTRIRWYEDVGDVHR